MRCSSLSPSNGTPSTTSASKLLSPSALLARLDRALDLAASGRQGPVRQKTLRDTIGWSYDLLTTQQQAFFRRLAVFAGGAELDAITAVTGDILDGGDALDLVAELLDASLAIITDSVDRDPRVDMLATIRAYGYEQLQAAEELNDAGLRHAWPNGCKPWRRPSTWRRAASRS